MKIDLQKFCAEVGLKYIKDVGVEYGYIDRMTAISVSKLETDIYYYSDVSMEMEKEDIYFIHTKTVYNHIFNYPYLKKEISSLIEKYKRACIKLKLKKLEKDFE